MSESAVSRSAEWASNISRGRKAAAERRNEHTDWLQWRRHGIGGSDAAAVCGLDPWRSPMTVWLDKTGRLPLEDGDPSPWLRMGRRLEDPIIEEFEFLTGLRVACRQEMCQHPEHPWMRATLDGLVCESPEALPRLGLLEIKTASWRSPVDWKAGVPDHVQLQVQHNLEVAQLDHAWVAVLLNGQELRIHELDRDPIAIQQLLELEQDFWQRVQEGRPPAADGTAETGQALREAFREPDPGAVLELEQGDLELVDQYRTAKAVEKAATDEAQRFANALMARLGEYEIGVYGDEPVVTWKRLTQERVDQKEVRAYAATHPRLARRFIKTESARRLHLPANHTQGEG